MLASNTATQAGNQHCVRRGVEDVPHFGFGFAAELCGNGGRRMDLKREPLASVEQFDEEWKAVAPAIGAEQLRAVLLDELVECLAGRGAVGDDGLGVGAVADFPSFADAFAGGDGFSVPGEGVTAPDAFDEDGFEFVLVEHVALAVG